MMKQESKNAISRRAKRTIWAIVLMVAGAASLLLAYSLEAHNHARIWAFAVSHLGIALILAGAIGLSYERWAHHERFNEYADALQLMSSERSEENLSGALKDLLPAVKKDPDVDDGGMSALNRKMQDHMLALISGTNKMEGEGIARAVSVRFVEGLLKYASDATSALRNGGTLRLPLSATSLAAEILSEQMRAMRSGDMYDVISDFATWRNAELNTFLQAIREIPKGSHVRRVFARFGHDDTRMTRGDVEAILRKHWQVAYDHRNYELAVSVSTQYEHVGMFQGRGLSICFMPPAGRLTEMEVVLGGYPKFDECWNDALPVRRRDPASRTGKRTVVVSFERLCKEIDDRDPTWWTRFSGPTRPRDADLSIGTNDQ